MAPIHLDQNRLHEIIGFMETNPTGASTTSNKAWVLFVISTVGMLVFAGLYFQSRKSIPTIQIATKFVTNTVNTTLTNEIVKEVPVEVEKLVEVATPIPEAYETAMYVFKGLTNAALVSTDRVLFNMKDICVRYSVNDAVKKVLFEEELKAKFELTLRRNNVQINPNSQNTLIVGLTGFWDEKDEVTLCYSFSCQVIERQWVFRGGEWRSAMVQVWLGNGTFGTVGKNKAKAALLEDVERQSEIFANDFLTANSKPK